MGEKSLAIMVSQKADERGIDKYMYIASPVVRERQRACSYTGMYSMLNLGFFIWV